MLRRKVYTGGSTPMVSLPKEWVSAHRLDRGGYVLLDVQDSCIVVEPEAHAVERREFVIDSGGMGMDELGRRIIAGYLAGYQVLRIGFDRRSIKLKEGAKELLNFLIAVEVTQDLGYEVTAQVLLDHSKLPVLKVVERLCDIVESMLTDLRGSIATCDDELLEHVVEREREADRLYFLAVRQLKSAAMSTVSARRVGIEHRRDVLGIRLIVKSLERIADHVESISRKLLSLSLRRCEELVEVSELVAEMYLTARESTLGFDASLAEEVFRRLPEVEECIRQAADAVIATGMDMREVIALRLCLESYYRIARYCCDMAEIVINMHAEVPDRRVRSSP